MTSEEMMYPDKAEIKRLKALLKRVVEADAAICSMGSPGVYRRHMAPVIADVIVELKGER